MRQGPRDGHRRPTALQQRGAIVAALIATLAVSMSGCADQPSPTSSQRTAAPTATATPSSYPALATLPTLPSPSLTSGGASLVIDGILYAGCQADDGCAYYATIDGPAGSWRERFGGTSMASDGHLVIDTEESHPPFAPGTYTLTVTGWAFTAGEGPVEDRLDRSLTACTARFDITAGTTSERLLVDLLPVTCKIGMVDPLSGSPGP